jgi:hypothetical protein
VSAMCRKCLKTASEEARRCPACGGRVVRFTETGEVVELDATAEEPGLSRGVPPLFGDLDTVVPPTQATVSSPQFAQPQPGGSPLTALQPPHGYCQPGTGAMQTAGAAQAMGYSQALNGAQFADPAGHQGSGHQPGNDSNGLTPPLPMGYSYTETRGPGAPPPAPTSPPEQRGTFLLPLTQLDDVVGEILSPFGFEAVAPRPPAAPAPPVEVAAPPVAAAQAPPVAVQPPVTVQAPAPPAPVAPAPVAPAVSAVQAPVPPPPPAIPPPSAPSAMPPTPTLPALFAQAPAPPTVEVAPSVIPQPSPRAVEIPTPSPPPVASPMPTAPVALQEPPPPPPMLPDLPTPMMPPPAAPIAPPIEQIVVPPPLFGSPLADPASIAQPMPAPPVTAPPVTAPPVSAAPVPVPPVPVPPVLAAPVPMPPVPVAQEVPASLDAPMAETIATSEPLGRKERQRKEREVSMAELARDIMSISEQESVAQVSTDDSPGEEVDPSIESDRQASFDLVIGRAPKGGRLRRSKSSVPKESAGDSTGFDPMDELATTREAEAAATKGRSKGRLRLR